MLYQYLGQFCHTTTPERSNISNIRADSGKLCVENSLVNLESTAFPADFIYGVMAKQT